MIYFLKALGFFLLSAVKFAVSTIPILMVFGYYTALLISISGGLFGVFFFMFLWKKIIKVWLPFFKKEKAPANNKIIINHKKRQLVRFKNKYGYWGVIISTPSILSIPIGVLLLLSFFSHKKNMFLHLSLSVMTWGLILISFFNLF